LGVEGGLTMDVGGLVALRQTGADSLVRVFGPLFAVKKTGASESSKGFGDIEQRERYY
jgi:hypothetical protein